MHKLAWQETRKASTIVNSFKDSCTCPLDIKAISKEKLMPASFYSAPESSVNSSAPENSGDEDETLSDSSFLAVPTSLDPSSSSILSQLVRFHHVSKKNGVDMKSSLTSRWSVLLKMLSHLNNSTMKT